ncbi:TonB-dependent receptor plug domain-containing protein [Massilia sp.]|uniref:TonB-dependent receptor plug domain-containing protein n=2 Tax=Burkholderiales TaxID=80840 RepID=UPI0028A64C03|nr:TonB-dependent receptor [Massilia sp.]
MLKIRLPSHVLLGLLTVCSHVGAQEGGTLADYSLEQLADIVVTSVARQETRLADAPASVYVIGGAEIRRSGAVTLPEALRLAPNLQVARADVHDYAISARGFGSTLSNKLLVLIDGRSVYSPLFSGVFWDTQDVVMADIERIEVISGPGATIWGANAVNGVINIITRAAGDTQGGQLVVRGGGEGASGSLRHGGKLRNGGHYRVYAKALHRDGVASEGGQAGSGWRRRQAGFRADWEPGGGSVTVSGDVYDGTMDDTGQPSTRIGGANLLARSVRSLGEGSTLRVQAYLDHSRRRQPVGSQRLDTADIEFQHDLGIGARQRLAWGGGYRISHDRVRNSPWLRLVPENKNLRWANLFVQDEIRLADTLRFTAGAKAEHNVYTGVEWLPSARLAWNAAPDTLFWAAASRTVRAPSRLERDLRLVAGTDPGGAPRYAIDGGPDFLAETARVIELGYRAQPTPSLSLSATLFHSDYDRLRTIEQRPGLPARFENRADGLARGLEAWTSWQPMRGWRLSGGAVLQDIEIGANADSRDRSRVAGLAANDPKHTWSLRSAHELAPGLQLDLSLRHVGALPEPAVPGYHELDARIAWQARPNLELALVGRNLLHDEHAEFGVPGLRRAFERSLTASAILQF